MQAQYNAPNGNIVATVKGTDVGVTPGNITVGTTGNYSVTTTAGTGTVILGQQGQTLPTFSISESVAGTLIVNRSITLTLPSGMYWTPTNLPIAYTTTGSVQLSAVSSSDISSNGQSLTYNITQADTGSTPSTIEFESGEVDVDTSATPGPVNVTVVGSGLNETVQAGTLVSSVTATAASNPLPSVLVGNQNQSVSNFTLTETKSGNMEAYDLWIIAPNGVTFDGAPTASVTSGDLSIGAAMLSNYSNGINNEIVIPVTTKSSNNAPGTISVSGLSINLSSSVPTGPISLEIGGPALVDNNTSPGWPTKGITYPDQITGTYVASVPVANVTNSVVTTTPTSPTTPTSGSADFTVGATVYSVNGVQYVMDVAPYISNGRTFVPVRYLGDALGATVSWDAATQTVTLTKGSNTETMNIGSTTMTVNGAAVTMDVAPVIVNSRTMLPARFVAQGLGAQVGWNPATQEVLITW
ncbi:MAG: copper amine oxidase N-terminal domain-containing protein [Peptococcaceae bacterium]|nr:copper amine oxidase N-terminal domain-containing protein [Peptococcaceae bacterium]